MVNRMKHVSRSFSTALLLSGATAVVLAQAPLLDVKPGLWEVTMTSSTETAGAPPADTSKMTPAQKAQMQAATRAMAQPRTDTQKKCVTKEAAAKGLIEVEPEEGCKDTVTANTKTAFDMKRVCTGDRTENSTTHMEASSREAMRATVATSVTEDGSTQKMNVSLAAKWLSADCGSVK